MPFLNNKIILYTYYINGATVVQPPIFRLHFFIQKCWPTTAYFCYSLLPSRLRSESTFLAFHQLHCRLLIPHLLCQ
ncbi:hypothetical protein Y032_0019g3864 [Ancylostoma ceylanicum]|uniref:Uncharacterized protein n=1 Tax=Ancylostoma ceylanicum TaxID=53326 RepID=A0A016V234_9BILA|nr:hypothetical protein Y032_0019g3864 [Ancylostoma ceylanicum]